MGIPKAIAAGAALLLLVEAASAQTPAPPPTGTSTTDLIEPAAVAALRASRAYLRTLKSFELRLEGTRDEVIGDDMKVELANQARYNFVAPNNCSSTGAATGCSGASNATARGSSRNIRARRSSTSW